MTGKDTARISGNNEEIFTLRGGYAELSEGLEPVSLPFLLDVNAVFPIDVDVRIAGRPPMGYILLLCWIPCLLELLHYSRPVYGMPDNDRIGHQM
jgi:hypothetical protein